MLLVTNLWWTYFTDVRYGYGTGLSERVPCCPPLLFVFGDNCQDLTLAEGKVVGVLKQERLSE